MNAKGKMFDKKKVECFNCHKMGHYSYECHAEKARGNEEVYAAQEDSDQEPLNLMVTTSGGDSQTESWYLDSGMGNVIIKRRNGSKAMITEVLYVPNMKCNRLSIGQLVEKGFSVLMKDDKLELFDTNKNLIIRSRLTRNRTFQVDIKVAEVQCLAMMEASNESWLWHSRYGHLNFRSLHHLGIKQMVYGLSITLLSENICDVCLVGKQTRNPFKV
ncbi:PREDICTED: uncharacterized protein LOC109348861 [Lupinus angustifolius]|uniref:uncharacterized protein LOC109348861 n=1 Tax=Lupinus angustifolius TaxID=3871 RepID=UPI00092F7754|nr:PREDICTED: uncharacterized protein LOC109348861 [Lupinus angustifolius]